MGQEAGTVSSPGNSLQAGQPAAGMLFGQDWPFPLAELSLSALVTCAEDVSWEVTH